MYLIWKIGRLEDWKIMPPWPASLRFPLPGLSYHVGHHAQLIGCGEAEVAEGELLGVGWTVERRIERAVGAAGDVDEAPLVDAWVELLHGQHVCSMRSKENGVMHFYLHHATCHSVMGCILAFSRPVAASVHFAMEMPFRHSERLFSRGTRGRRLHLQEYLVAIHDIEEYPPGDDVGGRFHHGIEMLGQE